MTHIQIEANKPVVFYHYPCLDGFTAAWAIWLQHPDWEFVPMKYGQELPSIVTGRDIYFVDFTAKRRVMEEWMMKNSPNSITILDHHKTAESDLYGFDGPLVCDPAEFITRKVVFDMSKSGARLAWEYFWPGCDVPAIIKYVEDRDLWRFIYSETKDINAYLFSFEYDFEKWNELRELIDYHYEVALSGGEAITRKHLKDIDELAQFQYKTLIGGYLVPVINIPYQFASDMCHKLAEGQQFAASYYFDGARGKYIYSLRSTEDGLDVSEIAKLYGGGGHKHAAGFESDFQFHKES